MSDTTRTLLTDAAERAIAVVRGFRVRVVPPIEVVVVSDSSLPAGDIVAALADGIGEAGGDSSGVRHVPGPGSSRTALVALVLPSSGRERPGERRAVEQAATAVCGAACRMGRDVVVVWCGHPATAPPLPDATLLVACWTPTDAMLRAAGRWLIRRV